jgi:nitric-oxide synthase
LARDAEEFLRTLSAEDPHSFSLFPRLDQVRAEIAERGTYEQTGAELAAGAKLAWRNSTRCVGRHHWQALVVRDCRGLRQAADIFAATVDHLRLSTRKGRVRPLITVFAPEGPGAPGPRIWNEQLIRYAAYLQPDGTVVGDPRNLELTQVLQRLGWQGGDGSRFDVLPVVIQTPGEAPRLFELPADAVLEVPITHPDLAWFAELGLRWHALPAISGMAMEIGGICYTAAPFNGWYMGSEIATRNLADENRYNQLPVVARRMGLDTRRDDSLWRDRALVELNVAVLHSFRKAGVTMVDHHTETRHFVCFERREEQHGRPVYADWSWIVPPISGSTTPVFHRTYQNTELSPNFFWLPEPWRQAPKAGARCPWSAA